MDGFYAAQRFSEIVAVANGTFSVDNYARRAAFILEYALAITAIYFCLKGGRLLGIATILLLWVLMVVDLSFHWIQGTAASISDIGILNAEIAAVSDAVGEFLSSILKALLLSSILFVPLLVSIGRNGKAGSSVFTGVSIFLLFLMYFFILVEKGEPALIGFPKGFSYGFGSVSVELNNFIQSGMEKKSYTPQQGALVKDMHNIIVVIDESIEWNKFEETKIGGSDGRIDYGRSFSAANCSAASNFILRRAGWNRDENTEIKQIDSLFVLAKKAGFRTIYIDNQRVIQGHSVRNYFDKFEISYIDTIVVPRFEFFDRDAASLRDIEHHLGAGSKSFILVNKVGAHFPYEYTIPPAARAVSRMKNYENSLVINSHNFLDKLYQISDDRTMIFYTSDHGQNLNSKATHCNTAKSVDRSEYLVPFVVMTKNKMVFDRLLENKHALENRLTHLEFSESVRNTLGYQIDEIGSIFKPLRPIKRQFCGIYGPPLPVFGIPPRCKLIE
jgi:hypothetical protein